MKVKISHEDIGPEPVVDAPTVPKYINTILNRANRWGQGTWPKVVGQLTDLFRDFPGKSLDEWERWYIKQKPDAIRHATEKILGMIEKIKANLNDIDHQMVESWTRYLVIVQTFKGLRRQKAVLKKGAEIIGASYRIATSDEEKKGIDGYIGDEPVSVKPVTYKLQPELIESLPKVVLYYQELDDGIEVDYSELARWKSKSTK